MSIQNGRPGSTVNSAPSLSFSSANGKGQHPLQSPKTQHITTASPTPLSPGTHTGAPPARNAFRKF